MDDSQSKASTLGTGLGCKERIERALRNLRCHAGTVVTAYDMDKFTGFDAKVRSRVVVNRRIVGLQLDNPSFAADRMHRIRYEVHDDLVQLRAVRNDFASRLKLCDYLDVGWYEALYQGE